MVPPVDQQLILEMLRRVEVLAGGLLTVTPTLKLCNIYFIENMVNNDADII